jgi:DNA-binding MarR family transcriptional regulator
MTEPRWLEEHEQQTWVSLLAVSKTLDTALDRQLQRDSGISHVTYIILSVLSNSPDATMSMTTLANLTNSSQSRISHAVARLEERGWVTRARPVTSRRLVLATLTAAGLEVLTRAAPGHVAMVRKLVFDPLTAEQVSALRAVNSAILGALDAEGHPYVGPLDLRPET